MTNPDRHDSTVDNHERFEAELLSQNQDAARVSTADIDEEAANQLICDFVDDGVVIPVPD